MLTIENGIIQDSQIFGVPVEQAIVLPQGQGNVRTQLPLTNVLGVTNHNTGNPNPGADARAHARWLASVEASDELAIGAHFFVDGARIVQTLPIDEVAWHAGDGQGPGNLQTVAVEICEVAPYAAAEANAVALNAALLLTHPGWGIYKHEDWSGKFCPRIILGRGAWEAFVAAIEQKVRAERRAHPRDNNPSIWAAEAVNWALAKHYLAGDADGDLRLHAPATREEVLVFLHRLWGGAGVSGPQGPVAQFEHETLEVSSRELPGAEELGRLEAVAPGLAEAYLARLAEAQKQVREREARRDAARQRNRSIALGCAFLLAVVATFSGVDALSQGDTATGLTLSGGGLSTLVAAFLKAGTD